MEVEADKDVAVPSPGNGELEAVEVSDESTDLPADLDVMDIDQVQDFLANVEQSQYQGSLSTVVKALNSVVKQLTEEIDASKVRMDAAKKKGGVGGWLSGKWAAAKAAAAFVSIYTIPVIRHDLPENVRLEPSY